MSIEICSIQTPIEECTSLELLNAYEHAEDSTLKTIIIKALVAIAARQKS
jgi:hypothetical protein